MNYPHNSIDVSIIEGASWTPASIKLDLHIHIEGGDIIYNSAMYLSRQDTEELIEQLKDKLGTLRYAKEVA